MLPKIYGKYKIFLMAVYLIFKYGKRFHCAPSTATSFNKYSGTWNETVNCSGRLLPDEISQITSLCRASSEQHSSSKRALRSEGTKAHAQPRSSRRSLNLDLVRVGENICFGFFRIFWHVTRKNRKITSKIEMSGTFFAPVGTCKPTSNCEPSEGSAR